MSSPADSSVQNLLPVQAYFDVEGNFVTFIGQNKPFYATPDPDQSGLHITDSTIDSSVIGGTTPAAGTFTSLATTTGTISTTPANATDIVNKQYVDNYVAGISWKEPALCATTANITLSGTQTIDNVAVVAGDVVLVKNQSTASENGIYTVSAGAWSRASGADTWAEYEGAVIFVISGSGNAGTTWYCSAQPGGTLGTTALNWFSLSISLTYTAGTGLTLTGTQFSITNTAVTAGSYGGASKTLSATVNAQGQLTALSESAIAISNTQVSGLGTMSTQNSNNVSITGGSISGVSISGYAQSGANSDITSLSGITGAISSPTYIQYGNGSGTTLAAGRMWYDQTTGTMNVGMGGGNITQQIGEEIYIYGKASAAITEGQLIMKTGVVGASGVITFAPTSAGITDDNLIIGIATENISLNSFGRITAFGVVHGINTSGFTDGATLWYDPTSSTGGMTATKPSAPNVKCEVGTVINAGSGGSGSIQVLIIHGTQLGGSDSNVGFSSLANNNLIQYNSSLQYWTNVAPSSVTGVGSVANAVTFNNGGAGDASGTTFNGSAARTISYNSVGAPSTSGTGASGTWSINVTGSAGSATTATTATNLAGGATGSLPYQASSGSTTFLAAGSDGQVLKLASGVPTWSSDSSGVTVVDDTTTNASYYPLLANATTGNITTEYVSSTKLVFNPSTGALGLGVTPSAWYATSKALQIGSTTSIETLGAQTTYFQNAYRNAAGSSVYLTSDYASRFEQFSGKSVWSTAPSGTAGSAVSWTTAMTLDASGNLGLGVSPSGSYRLEIASAASTGVIAKYTTTTGVPVYISSYSTLGGIFAESAGNNGWCANASSNYASCFTNGAERIHVDSSGNVGIGTGSPAKRLHVYAVNDAASVRFTNTAANKVWDLTPAYPGVVNSGFGLYNVTDNTVPFYVTDAGNATFSNAVRATITTDNDLSFDMNAASNFKCTPSAGGALTFTNITSGQTGNIILVNGSNYAITAAATTKVSATCLATISATGTYWLSYYSDGTNVYVANTGALA